MKFKELRVLSMRESGGASAAYNGGVERESGTGEAVVCELAVGGGVTDGADG